MSQQGSLWSAAIKATEEGAAAVILTMLTKAATKRSRMVRTPTRVLFILDWTIFLVSVCKAAGKT